MIKLKNINYSYGNINALKNINIEIKKGSFTVLKGPNGCGKSTLLKLLNGLIFLDSGEFVFNDKLITKKAMQNEKFAKKFHQKIGFVFQNSDAQLFCSNVYEEIAFGPIQMGLKSKEVNRRVEDLLKLFDIEKLKDRPPYHLSGGEKKKVAIASVLSINPEVIVLDEPFNGLDEKTQEFFIRLLNEMNKAGKTIILTCHDKSIVQNIINCNIITMDENHTILY